MDELFPKFFHKRLDASDWTSDKLSIFKTAISFYTPIASAIQKKYKTDPWFYWDMTSGSGLINNDSDLLLGSPLIALKTFKNQKNFRVNCLFTEIDNNYANELEQAIGQECAGWTQEERNRIKCTIRCVDYCEVLSQFQTMDREGFGLIYWDGFGKMIYPARELDRWLMRNFHHDLLSMMIANAMKRADRDRIDELIKNCPRIVSITNPKTAWEWVFTFHTNWRELARKLSKSGTLQLHPVNSNDGKEIIYLVSTTRIERESGLF